MEILYILIGATIFYFGILVGTPAKDVTNILPTLPKIPSFLHKDKEEIKKEDDDSKNKFYS